MKKDKICLAEELKLKSPMALLGNDDTEQIVEINLAELTAFSNHPFKVLEDNGMVELMESIAQFGIATPIIVRETGIATYEIIAGHRRTKACELLGLDTIPAIIRDLDDEEATVFMVDTNIQRELLLPSEKAFAYKMKLEALKKQGKRTDLTSLPSGEKLESGKTSVEKVADNSGESQNQIRRYIRLTELTAHFLDLVDNRKLPFQTAVELSYLSHQEQEDVAETMAKLEVTPSNDQATKLKKYSKDGTLTTAVIDSILTEALDKPVKTTIKVDTSKYFPKGTPQKEVQSLIDTLLNEWYQKNQT